MDRTRFPDIRNIPSTTRVSRTGEISGVMNILSVRGRFLSPRNSIKTEPGKTKLTIKPGKNDMELPKGRKREIPLKIKII